MFTLFKNILYKFRTFISLYFNKMIFIIYKNFYYKLDPFPNPNPNLYYPYKFNSNPYLTIKRLNLTTL